jgi:hypothetical protein
LKFGSITPDEIQAPPDFRKISRGRMQEEW